MGWLGSQLGRDSQTFVDEAGMDWCKAKSAPKTYALMEQAIGNYEEPSVLRIRL